MTCCDLNSLLLDYLAGELGAGSRRPFEQHLMRCAACRAYRRSYEQVKHLVRAAARLDDQQAPAELSDELVRGVLAAWQQSPS